MKTNFRLFIVSLLTAVFAFSVNAANSWGLNGSGTADDPYQVTSAADFMAIANNLSATNTGTGEYFKMMNDVDFGGTADNPVEYPNIGRSGVESLTSFSFAFCGTFDGNNKTITGLYTTKNGKTMDGYWNAIFCAVDTCGVIKNLIIGQNNHLVGYNYTCGVVCINKGTIENCTNNADIANVNSYGAGICGFLLGGKGTVKNCVNNGTISSKLFACGIVGCSQTLSVAKPVYYYTVAGNTNYGKITTTGSGASGIMGMLCGGNMYNNTNEGVVDGSTGGTYTSGIITNLYGFNTGKFYGNVNKGEVKGVKYVGGVVGYVMRSNATEIGIVNQTNKGAVSGNMNVGGIVGATIQSQDVVSIDSCVNEGVVTCADSTTAGNLRGDEKIALGTHNTIAKGLQHLYLDPEQPAPLKGDVNGDGVVNSSDISALVQMILNGQSSESADVNGDGVVNASDISALTIIILG